MFDRRLRRYVRHGMLTQLAAFEAVVRFGSFTRAAEALHMAQPTVSLLVKRLGETLGVCLFESTFPKIKLTPAGLVSYEFCQAFFQSFAGLDEQLTELRAVPPETVLRIAVSTSAESIAPTLLDPFCTQHPHIPISLVVANRAKLLDRLKAGADDFYIFVSPPQGVEVCTQPLQQDELHFYASVVHPYAKRRHLRFADIAREPLILREHGSGIRDAVETFYAEHDCKPNIRMEMDDDDSIKRVVVAGFGIALLSQYAVGPKPRHQALAPLPIEGLPIRRQWQLAYRADRKLSDVDQELIAQLKLRALQIEESYRPSPKRTRTRTRKKIFKERKPIDPVLEGAS
ncbi:MAG TPA: LysR family transcriptional regulator [Burkholderiales bacterium]|nr:LysR family transcriptional regulator [Burkholderiales bacterium]